MNTVWSQIYWHACLCTYRFYQLFWGGVSVAVSSHLRVTLVYVSHLRLVREPHTVGCLPMCCPLIHCMAVFIAKMSYAWRASRRDLRDPGRGDPGFRRSGLFCWTPSQDLAFLFWCFVFVSVQDLVIQWHHLLTLLELTGQGSFRCLCCLVSFLFLSGFCFCCFFVFSVFWAWLDFGLRNSPHSTFDYPRRDIAIAST